MIQFDRRTWLRLMSAASLGHLASSSGAAAPSTITIFDGKSLNGWIQSENNAISLSASSLKDPAGFIAKIASGRDALSELLSSHMDASLKAGLAAYSPSAANAKTLVAALIKSINEVIDGPSLAEQAHRSAQALAPETNRLLQQHPQGLQLAHLNKLFLEDVYPQDIEKSATTGWTVKDGAMASTGVGRGVIYTANDYSRYRLLFTMRHVSGNPDHQACVLIFCTRPQPNQKPLDALGGIQFQVPNGGHWDYRSGKNNSGNDEFFPMNKTHFDAHEWSRVEIVADSSKGIARMAVAQPVGGKAVEVVSFRDPTAGQTGPIAWQMHNQGLYDEYKDVAIEIDPREDDLITVR